MFDLDLLPPNEYNRSNYPTSPSFDSGISKGSVSPHSSLCGEFGSSDNESILSMSFFGDAVDVFTQDVVVKNEPDPDKVSVLCY